MGSLLNSYPNIIYAPLRVFAFGRYTYFPLCLRTLASR